MMIASYYHKYKTNLFIKIIFHFQLVLAVGILLSIRVNSSADIEDESLPHERRGFFVQLEKPSFSGHASDYAVTYPIDTCISTKTSSFSLSLNVAGGVVYESAFGTSDCSGVPIFVGHRTFLQPAPVEYINIKQGSHTSIFADYGATVTVMPNPTTMNHASIPEGVLRSIFRDEDNCETNSNAQEVSFSRHNSCAYGAFNGLYNQVVETGCSDGTGEQYLL
jgi:hypothetical protein